jgi:beta-lactamase regulating signal transducer with metallopeptidase domain
LPGVAVSEQPYVGTAGLGCPVERSSICLPAGTIQARQLTSRTSQQASTNFPTLNREGSPSGPAPASLRSALRWQIAAAALYFAVAMLLLTRFFIGLAFTRRLLRASRTIDDPRLLDQLTNRISAFGRQIPRIGESNFISVPVTIGALRSTILLPSNWRDWDDPKLDAILAHELSHVARRDALTQQLSLLHRAIFWFSPFAWWLDRHLATLAEQAADEAALSCGTDQSNYARILLSFFETLHATPGRVWWQGVSMAHVSMTKSGQAEKRLERVLSWKGSVAMRFKKSIAAAVIVLAIPVVYLVAAASPAQHIAPPIPQLAQDQTPPPAANRANAPKAQPTAAATSEPAPESEPTLPPPTMIDEVPHAAASALPVPRVAPVAVNPPAVAAPALAAPSAVAPVPPTAWSYAQSSGSGHSSGRGSSYSFGYGYDDNQRFVIVTGKSDSLTMSGDMEDAHHVEKLRKSIPGDFIWFERDEKSYVIRDQATIDRAKKFWAPQEELGKKQEALGKQQEILGEQQEALGAKMEQVQVKVPDMTAALDSLKAKLQKLGSSATMEQIGDLQSEIGELQSKIGEIQSQAGEQQGKLGAQQGALGEKQGKLGEEQGKLGEQQAKLAHEANRQMKSLFDEAIKNGTAQPEL